MQIKQLSSRPFRWFLIASLVVVMLLLYWWGSTGPAGNVFVFPDDFQGSYCLAASPEYSEAREDRFGYLEFDFDARGMATSSSFPRGKGGLNKAARANGKRIENERACATLSFEGRTIILGVVGERTCLPIDTAKSPSFEEALKLYCGAGR